MLVDFECRWSINHACSTFHFTNYLKLLFFTVEQRHNLTLLELKRSHAAELERLQEDHRQQLEDLQQQQQQAIEEFQDEVIS